MLPRLPTFEDAKISFAHIQKAQSFQVKKQSWVAQRCKYDTIPELGNEYWRTQQGQLSFQHLKGSHELDKTPSISIESPSGSVTNSSESKEWRERMDPSGRIYYVNLLDKRISWERPDNVPSQHASKTLEATPALRFYTSAADTKRLYVRARENFSQSWGPSDSRIRPPESSRKEASECANNSNSTTSILEGRTKSVSVHDQYVRMAQLNYPDASSALPGFVRGTAAMTPFGIVRRDGILEPSALGQANHLAAIRDWASTAQVPSAGLAIDIAPPTTALPPAVALLPLSLCLRELDACLADHSVSPRKHALLLRCLEGRHRDGADSAAAGSSGGASGMPRSHLLQLLEASRHLPSPSPSVDAAPPPWSNDPRVSAESWPPGWTTESRQALAPPPASATTLTAMATTAVRPARFPPPDSPDAFKGRLRSRGPTGIEPYFPLCGSAVTVCHYDPFHGQERAAEQRVLAPFAPRPEAAAAEAAAAIAPERLLRDATTSPGVTAALRHAAHAAEHRATGEGGRSAYTAGHGRACAPANWFRQDRLLEPWCEDVAAQYEMQSGRPLH